MTKIDPKTKNTWVDEGERVIVYDDLIWDVKDKGEWVFEEDRKASIATLTEKFDILGEFLQDDDFYQGLHKIIVIRRKADAKVFGFAFWDDISKHGEPHITENGDVHGIDYDIPSGFNWDRDYYPQPHVFTPVVEKAITAYDFPKEEK